MEVRGGQELATPRLQPLVAGVGLALGTVSVAARIERVGPISAADTAIAMPAQGGGSAAGDGPQHFEMLSGDPSAAAFNKPRPCDADEIGHLEQWPIHYSSPGGSFFLPGADNANESSGLGVALRRRLDRWR